MMIIYLTCKQVVSNRVLLGPARYDNIVPWNGLEYLTTDGHDSYQHIFSSWNGVIDPDHRPPNPQGGTINMTYWYLPIGGGNGVPKQADVTTLLLGGEGDNGDFDTTANPISTVNGSSWSGGLSVSTATEDIDIEAKSTLQMQGFSRWVKLWGTGQFPNGHYKVSQGSYCLSAAVYAQPVMPEPHDPIIDLTRRFIDPRDLYTDTLDERLLKYLDEISKYAGPSVAPDKLSKLLENVKGISPKLAKDALLKVKVDADRLNAIEKILTVLVNK